MALGGCSYCTAMMSGKWGGNSLYSAVWAELGSSAKEPKYTLTLLLSHHHEQH